jgi:hypothetical protein
LIHVCVAFTFSLTAIPVLSAVAVRLFVCSLLPGCGSATVWTFRYRSMLPSHLYIWTLPVYRCLLALCGCFFFCLFGHSCLLTPVLVLGPIRFWFDLTLFSHITGLGTTFLLHVVVGDSIWSFVASAFVAALVLPPVVVSDVPWFVVYSPGCSFRLRGTCARSSTTLPLRDVPAGYADVLVGWSGCCLPRVARRWPPERCGSLDLRVYSLPLLDGYSRGRTAPWIATDGAAHANSVTN